MEWLFAILFDAPGGGIYNVGSDQAVSIQQLAETVRSVLQTENQILIRKKVIDKTPPERYIPCINKIRKELHLEIKADLKQAIIKTVEWQ